MFHFIGNDKPLIILEYCPYGNLKDFLRSRRDIYNPEWKEIDHHTQLSVTDLVKFAFQISKGMEFLISRKVLYIGRILHGGAKIWILSSSGENIILRMRVANE